MPTCFALGEDGYIYLSNNGNAAGQGQIIRVASSVPESSGSLGLLALGLFVPLAYCKRKKEMSKA